MAVLMPSKDKKLAVFHRLSQQPEAVSLPELLLKMGDGFTERTVRQWISEMAQEGLVMKLGEKRGSRKCSKSLRTEGNFSVRNRQDYQTGTSSSS